MNQPLVPELHDALKLTVYSHYDILLKYHPEVLRRLQPWFPNTESWRGVVEHHYHPETTPPLYPHSEDIFRLVIADGLAAGYSRLGLPERPGREEESFWVYKLWHPKAVVSSKRLKSDEEVIALLKFLASDPSADAFLQKYDDILRSRAEGSVRGENLTSLRTHAILTGKFYRLLTGASSSYPVPQELLGPVNSQQNQTLADLKGSQWKLHFVRCRVRYPQRPIRIRDLNLLATIENRLNDFERAHPDNVFYRTSNELVLYLPRSADPSAMLQHFCGGGLFVEADIHRNVAVAQATELSNPRPSRETVRGRELPERFAPPICQLCQMAPASKHWPLDYIATRRDICDHCRETLLAIPLSEAFQKLCAEDAPKLADLSEDVTVEDLCEDCYNIRAASKPLEKLKDWSQKSSLPIAWVSLRLDFEELKKSLTELYCRHLADLKLQAPKKPSIKLPLISEFMEDFYRFRDRFASLLVTVFTEGELERVTSDLWCVHLEKPKDTMKILDAFAGCIEEFTPGLKELDSSPLRLAVVVSRPKFPFFEVLDIMEQEKADVSVVLPGRGVMRLPLGGVRAVVQEAEQGFRFRRSALEKLARIASISEQLARLTVRSRADSDYDTYDRFRQTGIGFRDLLTLTKLLEE